MSLYHRLVWPLLRHMDAEHAHSMAIRALKCGLPPGLAPPATPELALELWEMSFPNPIGLAAGFDKQAEVCTPMLRAGFGFVEAGTVTPLPQPGNPKPRIFRLEEDRAVINRLGFNSQGAKDCLHNLGKHHGRGIVGLNIGKNKTSTDPVADYVTLLDQFYPEASYITVNISSPNTQGLRDLQHGEALSTLLAALTAQRESMVALHGHKPLLLKVAPDLSEEECAQVAEILLPSGMDGLIIGNTTLSRDHLVSDRQGEEGGMSGKPLFNLSTQKLARFYLLTGGKLPLIGVGGISSGKDAYTKIRAGATLVQLYTALIYEGLGLVPRMLRELQDCMQRDGVKQLSEIRGVDAKKWAS